VKARKPKRTAIAILFCWLLTAAIVGWLAWDCRQTVYTGQSESWRATYSLRETGDPYRDPAEGVFVLVYTGDRRVYQSHQTIRWSFRHLEGSRGGSVMGDEPGRLPARFTHREELGWAHTQMKEITVEVSLDDGPPERFVLTER